MAFVGREVAETELVVVHGEELGSEVFVVGLAFAADVAGAPATVEELPFAVVDFHGVPRVGRVLGRDGRAGCERRKTKALAVAADDEALETSFGGDGGEQARIAFADRETAS